MIGTDDSVPLSRPHSKGTHSGVEAEVVAMEDGTKA